MADGVVTGTSPSVLSAPVERRALTAQIALRIGIIYVLARVLTTFMFLVASGFSGPDSRFGENPVILDFVGGWDAEWYKYLFQTGYPSELPRDEAGGVGQNAWAFMPIFAHFAAVFGVPAGSWAVGALLLSLTAGYLSCLVLFKVLRDSIGDNAAMWAIIFFASAPLAAMFQVGYAESLFFLWVILGIRCLQTRQFAWLYVLLPLMAFTRPGVLAFALLLGLYGVSRWLNRARVALPAADIGHILALGALGSALGFFWPILASITTGDPEAYLLTELAWRRAFGAGEHGFVPMQGWFEGGLFWTATWWGWPEWLSVLFALALVAGAFAFLMFSSVMRKQDPIVRMWSISYLLYLVAVLFPQSSIFRLLFPLSPLWGAAATPRSPWWRGFVLAACIVLQWWWIWNMYGLGNQYWQIP